MHKKGSFCLIFFALISCIFFSCETIMKAKEEGILPSEASLEELEKEKAASEKEKEEFFNDGSRIVTAENPFDGRDSILLSFAGDIMAHDSVWKNSSYSAIYDDVRDMLRHSDLAFANLETPVCNSKPYATYPAFNVHSDFADAAVEAGFNVFSTANNHTNDQLLTGIQTTDSYFKTLAELSAATERPVYASGLKDGEKADFSYAVIDCKGWKILFLAVTELLNRNDYRSYINYIRTDEKSRTAFEEYVRKLRQDNPCDLFVLSFHTAEPEYILTITKKQTDFYHALLKDGVDVIWANHPHVARDWEVIAGENSKPQKIIFYSQGNTISAQRTNPSFHFPTLIRDYTGDGFITEVRFLKDEDGIRIVNVNPVLITTYITEERHYVIKRLTEDFIKELETAKRAEWPLYLTSRKKIMKNIKGKITWQ